MAINFNVITAVKNPTPWSFDDTVQTLTLEHTVSENFIVLSIDDLLREFGADRKNVEYIQDLYQMTKFHTRCDMPFVAGGYWVRTLLNENIHEGDIDFFPYGENHSQTKNFAQYFGQDMDPSKNLKFEFDDMNYQIMGRWANCGFFISEQLITFNTYIEMIGFNHITDQFVIHKETIDCLKNRRFFFNTASTNRSHPLSVMKRLQKMVKRGFTVTDEDMQNMAKYIADRKNQLKTKSNYDF